MTNGEEMMDIKDLRRQGLTITRIAEITGRDRKTIRKYIDRKEPGPPGGTLVANVAFSRIEDNASDGVFGWHFGESSPKMRVQGGPRPVAIAESGLTTNRERQLQINLIQRKNGL